MPSCTNCQGFILFGGTKDGENRFCSSDCYAFWKHPGFCEECAGKTSDQPAGGTFTLNLLFGTRLMGFGPKCRTCSSQDKRIWFWFLIPLFPVSAKYKVIYCQPSRYISRKYLS